MEVNESGTSYELIKYNPKELLLLKNKYVNLQLIQNNSVKGFVHAIDPEKHSIILLQPDVETYQTVLIPGHAILNVAITDSNIKPLQKPIQKSTIKLVEKKKKLMSWFRRNQLAASEEDENIVLGSVLILPPYDITSIYSTSLTVTKNVRDIVEKMPNDFEED